MRLPPYVWCQQLMERDMEEELNVIMDKTPGLDHLGVAGTGDREELRRSLPGIERAMAWLNENPEADGSSYELKHKAEEALDYYLPNGALIAAAMLAGRRCVEIGPDSPNMHIHRAN
jgi:hypothetical protein